MIARPLPPAGPPCGRVRRRTFLADIGFGITGLALGAMLHRDGVVRAAALDTGAAAPDPGPHFPPRAKNVIWIFLSGGVSHLETWDPKPALNRYAGKTYAETPFENPFENPLFRERSRAVVGADRTHAQIFPLQVGFRKRGECGVEISDWWPELASCADDIAFVRSMYTTDNDHAAEFQFHSGRHKLDPREPTIGSWIHYGLGSLNENLPQFVFLGKYKDTRVRENFDALYLGPEHDGIELSLDPGAPLPFGSRPDGMLAEEQRAQFEFIRDLNALSGVEYPDDEQLRARIKAYELAYRMQASVPEALDLGAESAETERLYGIDREETAIYGRRLLAARRLAERGVRFTLVYLSDYGEWDSHTQLRDLHARSCARVDRPIAGLLKDLKRRGMDQETVVVCCTEFGRTPGLEMRDTLANPTGRDHHPHAFTVWLAGAGVKKGVVHGKTDELGFHVVEHPHYVTDIHATLLHLLGLDPKRLDIPGRKRLEIDHGRPIAEILA
ncbi:DUF1501 domain-containing protein [Tautonia sociabilis]|uniref:DUF1501 domain-containing protein n=1 Tax=Tautonia sociabilis TaxID=2080755 RepID=A0A432MEV0_9BACT|nr:DUF1501 domain-containing protein [Tautonia sociabilis]RUL84219.1 DUF1501 domain-containing protein [Tautonia sociabilis]